MGVNSLWDIIGPTARPVRLEALSRKKLAVDASIWIYQFLKAVRDEEGNAMQNSHIVGFFRRICKLLYFGILPIFVFDGGAPALKRQTINQRRERRQGKSESTRQIAQKLLAIQVQRQAERLRSVSKNLYVTRNDDFDDEEIVYLEDLPTSQPFAQDTKKENVQNSDNGTSNNKRFIRKDEFHLPTLKQFKVSTDDSRIMPDDEFQQTMASLDYVDGIDINSVDPASPDFKLLPISTQYMILSHLRIKSRLRMGYRKEQLEALFPNSMEFSKFQIQQVQKRNFYTQKLMNIAGFDDDGTASKRIAGDKDRKYALMRNDDGWTLSLPESSKENPIVVDDDGEHPRRPQKISILTVDDGEYGRRPEKSAETVNNGAYSRGPEANGIEDNGKESLRQPEVQPNVTITVDESDSDFEDIPLEPTLKSETQEEKNYQKALIESIYEQYEEKAPKLTQNLPFTHQFNDKELLRAIEESKSDLYELRKQEIDAKRETNGLETPKADSLQLKLDDNSKVEVAKTKSDPSSKPETKSDLSSNPDIDFDLDSKLGGSMGNSFLFAKPSTRVPSNLASQKEQQPQVLFESEEDTRDINNLSDSEELNGIENTSDNVLVENVVEVEDVDADETEATKPFESVENTTRTMPSWFNEDSISNPHENTFMEYQNMNESLKRYKQDEEVGLISWNEAKDMFGEDDAEEQNSDASDDIQEITEPSPRKEEVQVSEEVVRNEGDLRKPEILDYDFEEEDENELVQQLMEEEVDHENFKTTLKGNLDIQLNSINSSITEEQLLQEKLHKAKRDSDEVTQNMIVEVQELLKRFGIPYITAPMEAEAQCAELLKLNLVDGIITDDSDCFLFGGDRVYKNMFNQKQYVECYIADEIQAKLGIDQEKLIELALLLGSDYTDGIKGIGPVLAMEILAEFGTLKSFKKWFDDNTKTTQPMPTSHMTNLQKSLITKIKNGKLFLSDSFPDHVVFEAYKTPEVDHDKSEFKWGTPSLDQIRSFLMFNVNWSQARVDEVMVPLIRDMNRKKAEGTQSTIGEFFPQEYIQSRKEISIGKRMKTAANKLNKRQKP
jgi:DNA excision repair protein ERCC-5